MVKKQITQLRISLKNGVKECKTLDIEISDQEATNKEVIEVMEQSQKEYNEFEDQKVDLNTTLEELNLQKRLVQKKKNKPHKSRAHRKPLHPTTGACLL